MEPIILAHGAFGPLDEIILIGASVVFMAMLLISWFRTRSEDKEFKDDDEQLRTNSEQSDSTLDESKLD